MATSQIVIPRQENQTLGIAQFAIDFLADRFAPPDPVVLKKVEQFHLDSVVCAVAALGCGTNAPRVLREEATDYPAVGSPSNGASLFGSTSLVKPGVR